MGTIEVPTDISHISADVVTAALQQSYPGATVESLTVGTVINGTATKVRLMLDYNDEGHASGLPPTMWFKGGLEAHSQTHDMLQVYAGEAAFYAELAQGIDVNIPRAFAAVLDEQSGRSFVLVEDLLARNATFGDARQPLGAESVADFVMKMARLHSAYWGADELSDMQWLQGGGSLLQSCEAVITEESWTRCSKLPRSKFISAEFREFDTFRPFVLKALRTDAEQKICFVHGDCHIGNTFTDRDQGIGLLDWQSTMLGHWAHDYAYAVITSLTPNDRRRHERELLHLYINEMSKHGVELDWERSWLEYRKHTAYSCAWAICLPEWQPEDICCAVVERAFTAASDLESLKAWEG